MLYVHRCYYYISVCVCVYFRSIEASLASLISTQNIQQDNRNSNTSCFQTRVTMPYRRTHQVVIICCYCYEGLGDVFFCLSVSHIVVIVAIELVGATI